MSSVYSGMSERTKKISFVVIFFICLTLLLYWINIDEDKSKNPSNASIAATTIKPGKAILMAKTRREDIKRLEQEASQFGIIMLYDDEVEVKSMLSRIRANPQLAEILKETKRNDIAIFIGDTFDIHIGSISINNNASDEEIIKFLTD